MNYALKTIQNEKKIKQFEELYEDIIPIHLIESYQFEYKDNISVHKLKNEQGKEYIAAPGAKNLLITIIGHIKNENGDFTQSNDYIHKLECCMAQDKWTQDQRKDNNGLNSAGTVTLRVGNDIYENCIIKELHTEISSSEKNGGGVYDMKITAKILYNFWDATKNINGITSLNPQPSLVGDFDSLYC